MFTPPFEPLRPVPCDNVRMSRSEALRENFLHRAAVLAAALALGGCAGAGVRPGPAAQPRRVALVELPNGIDPAALRAVFAPDLPEDSERTRDRVRSAAARAEARAMADMREAATRLAGMEVVDSEAGADELLRFRVTDYGETPKTWRNWVIGWEVVSTLGIAAIAYSVPATRAVAGAYLVEESAEETVEAYSGFWALDKVCRPVRIEAELYDLKSGEKLWDGSSTGLADVRVARIVETVDAETRDAQIEAATRDSAEGLIGELVKAQAP